MIDCTFTKDNIHIENSYTITNEDDIKSTLDSIHCS